MDFYFIPIYYYIANFLVNIFTHAYTIHAKDYRERRKIIVIAKVLAYQQPITYFWYKISISPKYWSWLKKVQNNFRSRLNHEDMMYIQKRQK